MSRAIRILTLIIAVILSGCNSPPNDTDEVQIKLLPEQARVRLTADMKRLQSFSGELAEQAEEMKHLQESIRRKEQGHYTSDEHDAIENLLFRYLVCRESLWDMIHYYKDYRDTFSDNKDQVRGFILGFDAAIHLAYYSSMLVATFIDDDAVIEKLNEEYYRSDIPRGTYDKLFDSLTDIENIEALKVARELYNTEMADTESLLYAISRSESEYASATSQIDSLYKDTDERIQFILEKKSLWLPAVRNRLRQTAIVDLAQKAKQEFEDNLYTARGILFLNVSRIKSPLAINVRFSKKQISDMKKLLEPGDIILTFSAGYMSNLFLPGKFKHGITYVGSPEERLNAGLSTDAYSDLSENSLEKLKTDLETASLESGHEADLIEAVAEGVIFNSLEAITNEHIARLCVLRPHLDRNTFIDSLTNLFLLLGNSYDFKFDFIDASRQCCTEVIYRCLHKQAPIQFNLIKRMGVWTLSADDIVEYYLSSNPDAFDFVLYAEENADSKGSAVILTGSAGQHRLATLMQDK